MVLADKGWRSMADETSAAEIAYPLFAGRRVMRIVTSSAGKPVTAFLLTLALQQSFPLAGCSALRTQLAGANKVGCISREILTGSECG
jgi:hypothetical protein